jgi:hypothetical protein
LYDEFDSLYEDLKYILEEVEGIVDDAQQSMAQFMKSLEVC